MKLAIVGSRDIEIELNEYIPCETECLISGGAKGIDSCVRSYTEKQGIELIEFLPDYKRYGRAAPLIRNRQIVEYSDKVLIFWNGSSRGTKFVIEECKRQNKKYEVYII
ncbi:MAG: DUF2493 domain-containing protein [Clostridia bacterium]|nr:DUF2493 domain-containing protein [Clostridia bacterium]